MTYAELHRLLLNADDYEIFDEFFSKTGGLLDKDTAYNLLKDIWQLHENYAYRSVVEISGTSSRQIAIKYNIPRRTAEDWLSESNKIAPYTLELLAADILTQKYSQK